MKGSRMAKRSSLGSIVRKRLSDITNSQPQPKSPVHCENLPPTGSSTKDYIDSLLKVKPCKGFFIFNVFVFPWISFYLVGLLLLDIWNRKTWHWWNLLEIKSTLHCFLLIVHFFLSFLFPRFIKRCFSLILLNSKIIEFSGIEIQKLRVSLQKMQLQNWNLAQSNSHMLGVCCFYFSA